ncbi:hypothetical protein CLU79DRAFT_839163 [Phycomyces nitens]|nr:hypothetical protein CLU79DRAFT_839163 [Phycomyces nitens]
MATMLKAKALFDCNAEDEGEISFKMGDILVDVKKSAEDDWYVGRLQGTSTRGLFPFNYVEFITENSTTPPKLIPGQDPSDSTKNTISASVSPPNSITFSTWSVISNNPVNQDESDNHKLPVSKPDNKTNSSYDAFEFAMGPSFKQSRPLQLNGNTSDPTLQSPGIKPKPALGPKPAHTDTLALKKERQADTCPGSGSGSGSGSSSAAPADKPNFKASFIKNDIASRARSLSTSVVPNRDISKSVKPSLLQKDQDTRRAFEGAIGKLGTMSPKSLPNTRSGSFSKSLVTNETHKPQSKPSEDNVEHDEDEEDGEYQLVRPSQLRNKQQQIPVIFGTKPASVISSKKPVVSSFPVLPVSNPAPRLPSRPTSKANRRSKTAHSTKPNSASSLPPNISTIEQIISPDNNSPLGRAPPSLKPKPPAKVSTLNNSPTLPSRPKARSTSNPPPILPKPSDTAVIGLHTPNHRPPPPPIVNKPVIKPTTRSGISKAFNPTQKTDSASNLPMVFQGSTPQKPNLGPSPNLPARPAKEWQPVHKDTSINVKPSTILNNRTRSATGPSYCENPNTIDFKDEAIEKDKKGFLNQNRPHQPSTSSKTELFASEPEKKKVAPPPPPSRPAKNTSLSEMGVDAKRYQTLFDAIQDEGFVDGQTVKVLWQRSQLPSQKLAQIWRECDPSNNGLLDKQAFLLGMSKIDMMLKKHEAPS